MAETTAPPFPDRVGRYELLLPIGTGGMATVYLARTHGLGGFEREVALKLLHPHLRLEGNLASDFLQEARLAARVRHPNVVAVGDIGEDPTHGLYLVMDYVEGVTLGQLLRAESEAGRTLPLDIALRIMADALAGLHAAHELRDDSGLPVGVVHRDFTPQNILVGVDGVTRLTDFGIARAEDRAQYTATGLVKGKTGYMAPEQLLGEPLDRRCDEWAAAVVTWELLAGRRLFRASGEAEVAGIIRALTKAPARIRELRPDLPQALDDAIARALDANRDCRFATVGDLRTAMIEAAGVAPADAVGVARFVHDALRDAIEARRAAVANVVRSRVRPREGDVDAESAANARATSTSANDSLEATTSIQERKPRRRPLAYAGIAVGVGVGLAIGALGMRPSAAPKEPEAALAPAPPSAVIASSSEAPPIRLDPPSTVVVAPRVESSPKSSGRRPPSPKRPSHPSSSASATAPSIPFASSPYEKR